MSLLIVGFHHGRSRLPNCLSLVNKLPVAALWGASFLFIRVAVAELSPLILVGARFVVATLSFRFNRRS
jgi:hypothetical protein